ncbi:MAG: hypothetical protein ACTSWT_05010 [Candidatus Heimdallarchaeota archaeon]
MIKISKDFEDDLVANKIVPHESKKDLPLQRETFSKTAGEI